tara:strand:+ start:34182 stop:35141 length:960 start_codon:yes stop_codon:yes gene_type:complete
MPTPKRLLAPMSCTFRGGRLAAAFTVFTCVLLGACQTIPPPERAGARPHTLLDVPFVAQREYQCGPAALAMMLQWNHLPGDADQLVDEVWLPERHGSLGIELMAAGRARGLLAYPIQTPDGLIREVQAGHPVLILQNLALPQWPMWHYAVVIGYDQAGHRVILHSGTDEATPSHWNRFLRTWARAGYWGFVLLPPGQLPDSVEPEPLLKALAPLNRDALPHWRAAVARFPDNGRLRFGYANALWQAGQRDAGLEAFEQAVDQAPDLAPAWNNLAYARADHGDQDGARAAVCQAHTLAPESDNITASVDELTGGHGCPAH